MKTYEIPTGHLFVDTYSMGELETLSIGDYGKARNVKADFLGYTRPICGVADGDCMPLSEKWVVTISTQYGCPMVCTFCDVPKIPFRGNATMGDMRGQLMRAIELHPEVGYTERMNIHFARMGEPIFNFDVFRLARWLAEAGTKMELEHTHGLRIEVIHPVLTTSMPRGVKDIEERLNEWVDIKNEDYRGQAGLQISINSTSDAQRDEMFGGKALSLKAVSDTCVGLHNPVGRKYCLNFVLADGYEVDAAKLRDLFDPRKFMVKITPVHMSTACKERGIQTTHGYSSFAPYREAEENLVRSGFDVIVFVPSMGEERGLVTCGNAVLSGSRVDTGDGE